MITKNDPKMGRYFGSTKQKTAAFANVYNDWLGRRFRNIYIEDGIECDVEAIRQLLDEPDEEEVSSC